MSKLEVLRRQRRPLLALGERKPEPVIMKKSSLTEQTAVCVAEQFNLFNYLPFHIKKQLQTESPVAKIFSYYDVEAIMQLFYDDLKQQFQDKLRQALLQQQEEHEKLIDRILRDSYTECCSIYI